MATREQLEAALINADRAGDAQAAQVLAGELVKMQAPAPEGPGMLSQIGRQIGLTARAPLNAALSIPAMLGDVVTGGKSTPAVKEVLDFWFPKPEGAVENVAQDVAGAMAGGAGLAKATATMPTIMQQVLSAGGGAAGAGGAREGGFGPVGQIVGGIAGGVVAPSMATTAVEGGKAALRGAKALTDPFTEQGRRGIVARTMQSQAKDARGAAENIAKAREFVPGSVPNTAEASGDTGLAALQKALRNQRPAAFSEHAAAQDAARQEFLRNTFGNQTDVSNAIAQRSATTGPMRNAALEQANSGMPLESAYIQNAIKNLRTAPGKRASDVVQKTLQHVEDKIAALSDERGVIDARDLYTIRKELNTTIAQFSGETKNWDKRLTAGLETKIKAYIDNAIIKAGGRGWKDYLQKYADESTKIDAQKLGQEVFNKSINPTSEKLSTASFARQIANQQEEIAGMGARGSDALARVNMDLKRSAAPDVVMRAPGSDTLQNLVGANMLQRAGVGQGGPFGKLASGLLGKLYSPLEEQTQGLLTKGMLDSEEGMALLTQKISENPKLAEELLRRLLVTPGAGLLGTSVAQ